MSPVDRKAFCEIVLSLAELFGKELSPQALELYWRAMQAWPLEEFRAAAEHFLRAQFMPKPFDFEQLRRAALPTAGEAWARVLAHVRGPYRDGSGLDEGGPIDRAVAALGGYRALAFRDSQYLAIDERRFATLFDELVDVAVVRRAIPQLSRERTDGLLDHDDRPHEDPRQ